MSTAVAPPLTPEDLADVHEYRHTELVNGQLLEKQMSAESVWVAGKAYKHLDSFAEQHQAGTALTDGQGYQCFAWDESLLRRPDASFVGSGRLPREQFVKGHLRIAPDVMVEVVSPGDTHYEIQQRVDDFLEAGTQVCWVFNPNNRTVSVYRRGASSVDVLDVEDELTADDVLPGFRCPVGSLFPPAELPEMI